MRRRRVTGSTASICRHRSKLASPAIPHGPKNNFGQLFTDKPNTVLLNQILLTANKPLDPKATDFDWGFKLQGMYGSDARYTQFLGELNRSSIRTTATSLTSSKPTSCSICRCCFEGGIDIKAGQYSTPIGFETIDPSTNPFYSHSYIFNFGIPLKHTGFLTTSHVTGLLDVYLGVDTGVNTTFGPLGDNNGAVAFLGGFGLNMMDGNLTVLALTHIGPENATRALSPVWLQRQRLLPLPERHHRHLQGHAGTDVRDRIELDP